MVLLKQVLILKQLASHIKYSCCYFKFTDNELIVFYGGWELVTMKLFCLCHLDS